MVNKELKINDEIKFVEHMKDVIRKGMLGSEDVVVIGEEPVRRFFSGVLFPNNEFLQQVSADEGHDPQPVYRSLSKNCTIGLEFLLKPTSTMIKIHVSGNFKLYPRLFPSYEEQLSALEYLDSNAEKGNGTNENPLDEEHQDQEEVVGTEDQEKKSNESEQGLKLLEKYKQIEVCFENVEFYVDTENLDTLKWNISEVIKSQLIDVHNWSDLFVVQKNKIHFTGTVALQKRPENKEQFHDCIKDIRNNDITLPHWAGSIVVEPRIYRHKDGSDLIRLTTTLVNETPMPNKELGEKPTGHSLEFFDCNLSVLIVEGEHIPYEFEGAPRDYKYDKTYEVRGINCVGLRAKHEMDSEVKLITETVPVYFQKWYRTREDISVGFSELTTPVDVNQALSNIVSKMNDYLRDWDNYIANKGDHEQPLKNHAEVISCQNDMNEFREEIQSFELGIYSLNRDKRLMNAFTMMNEVFIKSGKGKYTSWRLFQIIFIVRMLPSLLSREVSETDPRKEEIIKSAQYADILWFPTGGGKTEAYLGLIITTLFYDRIRGKKIGCSAWIRFPLRMLSKQQLDRLAGVLIVAEEHRQSKPELNGKGVPFSIGFFAGGGNTDNFLTENKIKKYMESPINKEKAMLLHKCPSCQEKLSFDFDESAWKMLHRCTNEQCFVYNNLKGILPIYLTDSEVYRFVPSVLCGTVDKLAILGRYREFAHIFGQVGGKCPRHGYYSDRCIVGAYDQYNSCSEKTNSFSIIDKEAFYDPIPTLLIQDELHLLKEELGALNGHYEGVLNEFARNFGKEKHHLPKVIAATATIESYEHHVNHLYIRKPRKYPSMGYKNGISFYATSYPEINRRLYLGVLPHSRSQDEVIGRCLYLYHKEIMRLYSTPLAWKELNLQSITSGSEFFGFLSNYDLSVIYVNQKSMGHDVKRRVSESTNQLLRKERSQDFDLETEMLTGENDMDKIVAAIDRIESEGIGVEYKTKLHTLIATSLISHGVDLERINAFFMAGMPSKQAEYIQASSRSARTHAGLVVVSFRPNDLRERSQYQYFIQNHKFMDRLVDPVPINRLALKAIERTIPGILSGLLLSIHSQRHSRTVYSCGEYQKYIANSNAKRIDVKQELIEQIKRIIGTESNLFSLTARERAGELIEQIFDDKHHLLFTASQTMKIKDEKALNPITSFRDIEEGVPVVANVETGIIMTSASLY